MDFEKAAREVWGQPCYCEEAEHMVSDTGYVDGEDAPPCMVCQISAALRCAYREGLGRAETIASGDCEVVVSDLWDEGREYERRRVTDAIAQARKGAEG